MTASNSPPPALPFITDNIPDELKARDQWIGWRREWDDGRGEWSKIPVNIHTSGKASTTDPATWATYEDAVLYADFRGLDGVGYVFSADDPFCGVDLDKCRNPESGEITPWAAEIISALDSYTELSQSGGGAHAIINATKSGKHCRKGPVEIYDHKRFFIMTGHRLLGAPPTVNDRQSELDALYVETFGTEPAGPAPSTNGYHPPTELTDGDIVRLGTAEDSGKFARLFYDGDTSEHGGDDSAADEALACKIVFYTRDPAQVERIMSQSVLGRREKWTRRPDYRERTITRALELVTETYTPPRQGPRISVNRTVPGSDNNDNNAESDNIPGSAGGDHDVKQDRRSAADRLIGYARATLEDTDYLLDQFGQAHILVNGSPLALPRGACPWLRMLMWEKEKRGANGEALQVAAGTLEAMALHAGRTAELHVRSAWHDGALYVELSPGRVCRIDRTGTAIDPAPPVLFRRYVNLLPLPDPKLGGHLGDLLDLIVPDDPSAKEETAAARRLLQTYIVLALLPDVARPILLFTGPQGSGKTSRQRLIKRLLDPTKPESLRLDQRDFVQKVAHAHIVLFDNLNMLPDWAMDAFCRLVTGEADSKRVLSRTIRISSTSSGVW